MAWVKFTERRDGITELESRFMEKEEPYFICYSDIGMYTGGINF